MDALEIIERKMNTEGFNVSKHYLVKVATKRIHRNLDTVLRYGRVVFTVSRDWKYPVAHMYALHARTSLLPAFSCFMKDVWKQVPHQYIVGPVRNETVAKICRRFGWREVGIDQYGFRIFRIERPQ